MLLAAVALLAVQAEAAPAAGKVKPEPEVVTVGGRGSTCGPHIIHTDLPAVRLDRPFQGGVESKPYKGEPTYVVSAVERTVGGCAVPVVRVRYGAAAIGGEIKPVEKKADR